MNKAKSKDLTAIKIGSRIKQARQMAGFKTQKDLNKTLIKEHQWSSGRLGNYEAGQSTPGPDDVSLIAKITASSACWIMFGSGPIRSGDRDLQAIRHQNLVNSIELLRNEGESFLMAFYELCQSNDNAIKKYTENPFRVIGTRQTRRIEKALGKPNGWLDEQHIEIDPVCANFPDNFRELMMIYSELSPQDKKKLLEISRVF